MLIAITDDNIDVRATPHQTAHCKYCNGEVISKCGDINVWHWAHKVKCIYESEPETEWHIKWKSIAENNGLEIEYKIKDHITDAIDHKNRICYEFQHSPITKFEIMRRALTYKSLGYTPCWIFDYRVKIDSEQLILTYIKSNNIVKFQQKWNKKTITDVFRDTSTVYGKKYFDVGNRLINIQKLYENGNGWGYVIDSEGIFL